MRIDGRWGVVAVGLALVQTGCPVTDDYYLEAAASNRGGVDSLSAGTSSGGFAAGASVAGSSPGAGEAGEGRGGSDSSTSGAGGEPAGAGGEPPAVCLPRTERCNGHDDDCDGFIDEMACGFQATFGCFGFTLADRDDHGYMLCSLGIKHTFFEAELACQAQDMRLAWIESATENANLSAKISAFGGATEVLIGASDGAREGDWYWSGGSMFWKGAADGSPVDGAFTMWADGAPNNMNEEDCVVLYPGVANWGDRSCSAYYSYLCEDREPSE